MVKELTGEDGDDDSNGALVNIECDLHDIDIVGWLFCHAVASGDLQTDSIMYEAMKVAMLTAYGLRNTTDTETWSDFKSLYEFSETMQNRYGPSAVHLMNGPGAAALKEGEHQVFHSPAQFLSQHNFVVPTPRTLAEGSPAAAGTDGVYSADLSNFIYAAELKSRVVIKTTNVVSMPIVLATDGMVIRPGLTLSTASNPPIGALVGLEGEVISYEDVTRLSNMPPEDVVKELQSKKWADNMVEVHATTLDGRVSDTLGCFLKGKGDQVSIYFSDHSLYSFLLITILILFTVLLTHSHYLLLVIVDQSSRHILLLIHFTLSLSL